MSSIKDKRKKQFHFQIKVKATKRAVFESNTNEFMIGSAEIAFSTLNFKLKRG